MASVTSKGVNVSHLVRNETESESNRKHLLTPLTDNPGTSEQDRGQAGTE